MGQKAFGGQVTGHLLYSEAKLHLSDIVIPNVSILISIGTA